MSTNYIFLAVFLIYDSIFRFYDLHSYSIICKNILSSSSFLFFPSSYFPLIFSSFPQLPFFLSLFSSFFLFQTCIISSIWSAIFYERSSCAPALSAVLVTDRQMESRYTHRYNILHSIGVWAKRVQHYFLSICLTPLINWLSILHIQMFKLNP